MQLMLSLLTCSNLQVGFFPLDILSILSEELGDNGCSFPLWLIGVMYRNVPNWVLSNFPISDNFMC